VVTLRTSPWRPACASLHPPLVLELLVELGALELLLLHDVVVHLVEQGRVGDLHRLVELEGESRPLEIVGHLEALEVALRSR
jgi:hypothetical protein